MALLLEEIHLRIDLGLEVILPDKSIFKQQSVQRTLSLRDLQIVNIGK